MKKSTRSIDDEQTETVEEHYDLIMDGSAMIDSENHEVTPENLPAWFDEQLFKKGQDYCKRNLLSINLAYLTGLIAVFVIPSISKILICTNQSSTAIMAFRRYFQTLLHIYNLHVHNVMDPNSKFYKSLNVIRRKHATNSKRFVNNREKGISQKDMVLTQFGFVGYALLKPEQLSLTNKIEERQGLNHFWRVLGHLLGISDRLNICRKNEYETTLLCKKLLDEVYVKELKNARSDFYHLTNVALEGLKCIDPMLDKDAFLTVFYELNGSKYECKLGLYSTLNLAFRRSILFLMKIPIIGCIVRSSWNVYLRTIFWIYERWPIFAWLKYGKENSKINLYNYPKN